MRIERLSPGQVALFGHFLGEQNVTTLVVKIGPVALLIPLPKKYAKPNPRGMFNDGSRQPF